MVDTRKGTSNVGDRIDLDLTFRTYFSRRVNKHDSERSEKGGAWLTSKSDSSRVQRGGALRNALDEQSLTASATSPNENGSLSRGSSSYPVLSKPHGI